MPAIIALAIRALIQFAITLGIVELAEKYALPLFNRALQEVIELFGVSEEDAKDIVANEILIFAEKIGIGALTLRTKIPSKIAELLGFTTKGFSKRVLSTAAQLKVGGTAVSTATPTVATVEVVAQTIAKAGKGPISIVKEIADFGMKIAGVTFLGFMVTAQFIDFGNWNSGAYQKTFQGILSKFGLVPDQRAPTSNVLSDDMWRRILGIYIELGAVSILDPERGDVLSFTSANFRRVVDKIASRIIFENGKVTLEELLAATQMFITLGEPVTEAKVDRIFGVATAQAAAVTTKTLTQINIEGIPFGQIIVPPLVIEKISNQEELKEAIRGTIAQFTNQIANRLSFEIQMVRYWVDPQGQMIVPNPSVYIERKTTSIGESTKTVQNKIVVLSVYFTSHEAKRVKIYAWPLDYSVADSVITEAPEDLIESIPIRIESTQQILSQPGATAAPTGSTSTLKPPLQAPAAPTPELTRESIKAELVATGGTSYLGGPLVQGFSYQGQNFTITANQGENPIEKAVDLILSQRTPQTPPPSGVSASPSAAFPRTVTVAVDVLLVRASPTTTAPLAGSQRLSRGDKFTATSVVQGESVQGENRWWVSSFGNYVWAGGTIEKP